MIQSAKRIVSFFTESILAKSLILFVTNFANVEKCYKIPPFVIWGETDGLLFDEMEPQIHCERNAIMDF